ncbi:SIS domain-containing protein, partial [Listeria monocytogenes]|uniref:SIS domain-containing protein n=1 Tax=Listeria monocytogenes TaxID=1639 RepID=UPI001F0E7E98
MCLQSQNCIRSHHQYLHYDKLVADSIMNDGIIQAFGSGHSYAAAIEVCGRAGGLIPSKVIM